MYSSLGVNPLLVAVFLGALANAPSFAIHGKPIAEGVFPDVAVGKNGQAHLVYGRGERLYYRTYNTKSGRVGTEQAVPIEKAGHPYDLNRADPDIVVDSSGNPHVYAWGGYAYLEENLWRSVPLYERAPIPYRDSELAIDSQDTVYLCNRGGFQSGNVGLQKCVAGTNRFVIVTDPDAGHSDPSLTNHVYGDLAVSPVDDSLHFIQRHGLGRTTTYRHSKDGGANWDLHLQVCKAEPESPHIAVDNAGHVVATNGYGELFRLRDGKWFSEGNVLHCEARDQPELAVDAQNNIYVACFGGQFNIRHEGVWGEKQFITTTDNAPIGFVELAGMVNGAVAVWEEGEGVRNDEMPDTPARIMVGTISPGAVKNGAELKSNNNSTHEVVNKVEINQSKRINRFGYFQETVTNDGKYADPYGDVSLEATFSNACGETFEVDGFYDGNNVWRIRFRADVPGSWKYNACFSDGSPGKSGTFYVLHSTERAPIQINPSNPIWFRQGAAPFYIRALHIGDRFFAENWSDKDRSEFLDWFQKQGYNTLSIASHYLNRDREGRGKGWDTPKLWPLEAGEFQKMERILDDLDRRGIVVFPFSGFIGKDSNYPLNFDEQKLYIKYVMSRIGHHGNLLYNVAGPEPNLGDDWLSTEKVEQLGRLIRDSDVYSHPLSVHNRTGDDPYRDSDWTSFGTLQGPKTLDRKTLSKGILESHHPAKPLFAQETLWSGNIYHIQDNGRDYSNDDLRKHAYTIAMSGAMFCFADNNGNSSSGLSGTLEPTDATIEKHHIIQQVWNVIESFPYFEMQPTPDAVDRGYCLAEDGRRYLIYQESGGSFKVFTSAGPYCVTWVNPKDPSDIREGGLVSASDEANLKLETPLDGDDWLAFLTSTGTDMPPGRE